MTWQSVRPYLFIYLRARNLSMTEVLEKVIIVISLQFFNLLDFKNDQSEC